MKRKVKERIKAQKHVKRVARRKAHREPIALAHYRRYREALDATRA